MAISNTTVNQQEPGWAINSTSEDLSTSGRVTSADATERSVSIRQISLRTSAAGYINYSVLKWRLEFIVM